MIDVVSQKQMCILVELNDELTPLECQEFNFILFVSVQETHNVL